MAPVVDLPTTYDPRSVEASIYKQWLDGKLFHADPNTRTRHGAYTIVIPPPNVTGALHGGHALNNTLQDILIRWRRMQGCNTLWMPGTDHAGIATQAVVERTLFEKEKKTRHDLGREALVKRIWEWKEAYGNRIIEQLKRMGCSCDWERTRFTLDETCARAVRETFFRMFKDGLIVRGKRLVNWDTHLQTAVADDEVYHEKVKGHLWHIRYPFQTPDRQRGVDHLVVATTRPETMLGDTAVAVHPDDERWNWLIGQKVILPLVNREIRVIGDPILVSMEFGTGCVKVTPAHDPNDYQCGHRHGLEMINILTPDGHINENGGRYQGMDRYAARKKVVADLEAAGLMVKVEDHESDVGHSDRSKTPIEPYLSDQWFVRMGDLPPSQAAKIEGLRGSSGLAQLAIDSICTVEHPTAEDRAACGKVHFFPERYANTYRDWLSEKRDWCISRQLWWGHRIPVWHLTWGVIAKDTGELVWEQPEVLGTLEAWINEAGLKNDVFILTDPAQPLVILLATRTNHADKALAGLADALVHFDRKRDEAYVTQHPFGGGLLQMMISLEQDPDVLDTWFSSALWPHSTLAWPEVSAELKTYYPGSVLSTAREIITLWVARMVLTGMYNIGRVPFHDVYIHLVIQDAQGRPFKKTLGNGFDPVDIIEMYGADALRFTMASVATETQDIRMPMKKVKLDDGRELQTSERFELGRNFCNKVWNAARFAFMNLVDDGSQCGAGVSLVGGIQLDLTSLPIEDRWILSRGSKAAVEVQDALAKFQFSKAVGLARDFFWDSLCDWYLELVKSRLKENRQAAEARQILAFALDQSLRLLHPFVPFITERLWQQLNGLIAQRGLTGLAELDSGKPLIVSEYPPVGGWPKLCDPETDVVFDDLQTATRAVRDIRQTQNVAPKQSVNVVIRVPAGRVDSMKREAHVIRHLANVGELTIGPDAAKPGHAATLIIGDMEIYVADVIDPVAERGRLEKELANLDKRTQGIAQKLANEGFIARAPADLVARERERLVELEAKKATVAKAMSELQ
ncbi:MAG: valine--tRNA ligase [Phycisphaerae bacterium]|nr:valine--tRNA ligase [Phycisphaerae bacterium]